MNILVVGSEGTIGKPLTRHLIQSGHNVYRSDLQHHEGQYMRCDISEFRQVQELFIWAAANEIQYIYWLAAEFGRQNGEDYYEQLWKSNVIGAKNLLRMLAVFPDIRVVFFSSSEVYGELQTSNGKLHEDDMLKYPVIQHNDYAITKWVNEKQIINGQILNPHLQIMRVRLFNAFGKEEYYNDYRSVVCLFCYRVLHNLPITIYKNYYRVFMHVDDLVNTLGRIPHAEWDKLNGNVVNIGGTEYCSVEDMHKIISKYVPDSKSAVTYLAEDKHNTVSKMPDISRAVELLGHNPRITLEEGIAATLDWMRDYYKETISAA